MCLSSPLRRSVEGSAPLANVHDDSAPILSHPVQAVRPVVLTVILPILPSTASNQPCLLATFGREVAAAMAWGLVDVLLPRASSTLASTARGTPVQVVLWVPTRTPLSIASGRLDQLLTNQTQRDAAFPSTHAGLLVQGAGVAELSWSPSAALASDTVLPTPAAPPASSHEVASRTLVAGLAGAAGALALVAGIAVLWYRNRKQPDVVTPEPSADGAGDDGAVPTTHNPMLALRPASEVTLSHSTKLLIAHARQAVDRANATLPASSAAVTAKPAPTQPRFGGPKQRAAFVAQPIADGDHAV